MKLGLGTVEFAVRKGKHAHGPSQDEAREILAYAKEVGIRLLDTAASAGNSEEVLGECLPGGHPFRIVVKTPSFDTDAMMTLQADQLEPAFRQSLERMNQDKAYALMIGMEDGLFAPQGERLYKKMEMLREQGLIEKIGVSVADGEQIDRLLARHKPDIIQLPLNVLDQRLLQSGHLARLKQAGIEIHVRDIFLQGMLLDPTHLHPWFWPIRKRMETYHDFLVGEGLTPLEGALGFVTALEAVDCALIGIQSVEQLAEFAGAGDGHLNPAAYAAFACLDEKFINPLRWNLYE